VTARRSIKSPQADADLAAIWRESAKRHGRDHADRFVDRVYGRFELWLAIRAWVFGGHGSAPGVTCTSKHRRW
jgi:hypothetical protein